MRDIKNKQFRVNVYLLLLLYVFVISLCCSKWSPLLGANVISDDAIWYCIGNGIVNSHVAHVELADHKGLYLFFLYAAGNLISPNSFIGIFLVWVVIFFLCSILVLRIIEIYTSCSKPSAIIGAIVFLALSLCVSLEGGVINTEQAAMLCQLISFYFILKYSNRGEIEHPTKYAFVHGITAAVVFELRANMVLMWGGIFLVFACRLIKNKSYKNLLDNIIYGIFGFGVGLAPMLIYCFATKSIHELVNQEFIFNVAYSSKGNYLEKVLAFLSYKSCIWLIIMLFFSSYLVIKKSGMFRYEKILFILMEILEILSLSMGKQLAHYYIALCVFLLPFVIFISIVFDRILNRRIFILTLLVGFVFTITLNLRLPIYVLHEYGYRKSPSYLIEEDVKEILSEMNKYQIGDSDFFVCYGDHFHPQAFYAYKHVVPPTKWFYIPAISFDQYPEPYEDQKKELQTGDYEAYVIKYVDTENRIILPGISDEDNHIIKSRLEKDYRDVIISQNLSYHLYIKKR